MRPLLAGIIFIVAVLSVAQGALAVSSGQRVASADPIKSVTVSIYSYDDDCTGVRIAPQLILTARHCQIDGTTRVIFSTTRRYQITGHFVPRTKPVTDMDEHDLAILRIETNVPGPVAIIADESATPQNGTMLWMAGYGGQKVSARTDPLRKLAVKMTDRNYSPSAVAVRTTAPGAVCDGDSGGPGYTEQDGRIIVWGIDSGPLDGRSICSSLEVFAKVAAEHDWINKIISDQHLVRF
jgi:Trypsin